MAEFNDKRTKLTIKLVYYGPASGKTTNLMRLHDVLNPQLREGEMMVLETNTDHALFFDPGPELPHGAALHPAPRSGRDPAGVGVLDSDLRCLRPTRLRHPKHRPVNRLAFLRRRAEPQVFAMGNHHLVGRAIAIKVVTRPPIVAWNSHHTGPHGITFNLKVPRQHMPLFLHGEGLVTPLPKRTGSVMLAI
ncbi:MAG TPA: hypothetical protein VKA13_08105 [Gammaproteobacteria bacterium]|nr:hypothetical protein [Gammaproteobacteria bacterium]